MDHTISMQSANMMGPLTQQMNHMSMGTSGTVSVSAAFITRPVHILLLWIAEEPKKKVTCKLKVSKLLWKNNKEL